MQPWMFAIATIVSFVIFKFMNPKKQGYNESSSKPTTTNSFNNDIAIFGYILTGFMALSYWFNSTGTSTLGVGMGEGMGEGIKDIANVATFSEDIERNLVNNILQDVNVGYLPF